MKVQMMFFYRNLLQLKNYNYFDLMMGENTCEQRVNYLICKQNWIVKQLISLLSLTIA